MNIETVKLENQGLNNKTSYYLKITDGNIEHVMNIGEATYNKINEMLKKKPKDK